jgi:hypothetical protein
MLLLIAWHHAIMPGRFFGVCCNSMSVVPVVEPRSKLLRVTHWHLFGT